MVYLRDIFFSLKLDYVVYKVIVISTNSGSLSHVTFYLMVCPTRTPR